MATPSLQKSFDASLVAIQQSFSSTETNTSGSSAKENQQSRDTARERTTRDLSTVELYAQWADTYDSDGNFLQATDDIQTSNLIPELVADIQKNSNDRAFAILDFGCGTGRTTMKLVNSIWDRRVSISAWDSSDAMLSIARTKCEAANKALQTRDVTTTFRRVDLLDPETLPRACSGSFHGIVSTLVLEHIPLETFWKCMAELLKPGGYGLVSNMHPNMGARSVAGFDDDAGTRLMGKSWLHGVEETANAARRAGLEIVGDIKEAEITREMIEDGPVGERGRKWIGTKVWFGFTFRKPQ